MVKEGEIVALNRQLYTYPEGTPVLVVRFNGVEVFVQMVQKAQSIVNIAFEKDLRPATTSEVQQYLRAAFDTNVVTVLKIAAENDGLQEFAAFFKEHPLESLILRLIDAIKDGVLDRIFDYKTTQKFLAFFSPEEK